MRVYASAEMTLTDTNDGISVTGIDRYYMASSSSSGITVGSQGWKPDPQETNPVSRYHWSYEVVNYSDGAKIPSKPAVIGVYGKDGKEGIDAVTVSLSSEAHTFAGTESRAIASSITIDISAFKGSQRIPTSIGTVTGGISGQLTHSELGRGTTNNKLVINATSALAKANGTLSIPIVADGRTFNKVFSWSVAFKGIDGTTTYTWIRYADTPTSGMNDFPDGKKYIGLAFNKTTQTESNNYSDYQWSLMPQNIEFGGRNYFTKETPIRVKTPGSGFVARGPETPNGFKIAGRSAADTSVRINNVITSNGWWTVSFDIRGTQSVAVSVSVDINDRGSTRIRSNNTDTYERQSVSVYVDNYSEATYNFVDFDNFGWAHYLIDNIKVEKGNTATDWSPAPEDVYAYSDDVAQAKAEAERIKAEAYADGKVSDEEKERIAQAEQVLKDAKAHALKSIQDIEIGGVNLVNGSAKNLTSITIGQWGYSGMLNVPIDGKMLKHGDTVTFSVYVEGIPSGEAVYPRLDWYRDDGTYGNFINRDGRRASDGIISITAKIPNDSTFTEVRGRIVGDEWKSNYAIKYKHDQLEKGNKRTDWAPSPEDVEAAYTAVAQAKAEAERIKAESYADGKVTAEEEARIADADAKLAAAKKYAEDQILADKTIKDTRAANENPSWYFSNYPSQIVREFKNISTMGLSVSGQTYGILTTDVPWTSSSGGAVKQEFKVHTKVFKRSGTSTAWTPWVNYDDIAETAKSDAATAKGIADGAASSASTANSLLTDIASDSKLTATEKKAAKKEWDIIVGEKPKIDSSANTYGIITEKTAYNTAYQTLNNYLSSLLANLNTTSNIVGTTFRSNFRAYYNARQDLLNKIADGAKSLVDEIEVGGRNLLRKSGEKVSNGNYNIARYDLTDEIKEGEEVTLTIWGSLATTKSSFRAYNSGGIVAITTLTDNRDGTYSSTFKWKIGSSTNTYLNVYAFTNTQTGTSTINKIKLEKGNKATDWTPATEDLYKYSEDVAQAKAEAERVIAEAYADGIVSDEERKRIAEAAQVLKDAKAHALQSIKDIDIGGRNLLLGTSDKSKNYTFLGWGDFVSDERNRNIPVKEGETYTFRVWLSNSSSSDTNAGVMARLMTAKDRSDGRKEFFDLNIQPGSEGYSEITFTVPKGFHFLHPFSIRTGSGSGNYEVDYQYEKLEKGNKATDWTLAPEDTQSQIDNIEGGIGELYLADKTDVLSGQEVFTDKADEGGLAHVEIDGKSVGGGSGKNLHLRETDEFRNTTWNNWNNFDLFLDVPVKPNTTYTASVYYENRGNIYIGVRIFWYGDFAGQIESANGTSVRPNQEGYAEVTAKSPSNAKYARVVLRRYDNSGGDNSARYKYVQLEEGSRRTDYERPSPSTSFPIKINSLNNFDIVSDIGKENLIKNSSKYDHSRDATTLNTDFMSDLKEPLIAGQQYTFSFEVKADTPTSANRIFINSSTTIYKNFNFNTEWTRHSVSFVYDGGYYAAIHRKIHPHIYPSGSGVKYIRNIKLEHGNSATPYSPSPSDIGDMSYHPTIDKSNISLSEPLRSVDNIKDRLFVDSDGVWKVERKIGELVIDGSMNWNDRTGDTSFQEVNWYQQVGSFSDLTNFVSGVGASSHFKTITDTFNDNPQIRLDGQAGRGLNLLGLFLPKETVNSTSELKQWLSANPVTILYVLENPTIEILPMPTQDKLNNLSSFAKSNYVYTVDDNNLKPNLNVVFKSKGWRHKFATDKLETDMSNKADKSDVEEEFREVINSIDEFRGNYESYQDSVAQSMADASTELQKSLERTATIETTLGEGAADWIFTQTHIRMSDEGVTIGQEEAGSYLQISNNQISFFNGSEEPVAFINGGMLHINHAIFVESIQISGFMVSSEIKDHITFRYVGN